jgi:precorrin-6A/cobalt-precorrin-6A reductase
VEAAKDLGIEIIMIGRPKINYGTVYSNFFEVIRAIRKSVTNKSDDLEKEPIN